MAMHSTKTDRKDWKPGANMSVSFNDLISYKVIRAACQAALLATAVYATASAAEEHAERQPPRVTDTSPSHAPVQRAGGLDEATYAPPALTPSEIHPELRAELLRAILADDVSTINWLAQTRRADLLALDNPQLLLIRAAVSGSPEVVEALARVPLPLDRLDGEGYTAIMRALEAGRADTASTLKALGASLEGVSVDGYSVRGLAEMIGLADWGPDLSRRPRRELEASLLIAAEIDDWPLAEFALKAGARPDARAENGMNVTLIAAWNNNAEFLEALAAYGGGTLPAGRQTVLDPVEAALIGGEGNPPEKTLATLRILRTSYHGPLDESGIRYAALARKLSLAPEIRTYFPPDVRDASGFFRTPVPLDPRNGWASIQESLAQLGLYDMGIDGMPGPGTRRAFFALLRPVIETRISDAYFNIKAIREHAELEATPSAPSWMADHPGEAPWYEMVVEKNEISFRIVTEPGVSGFKFHWSCGDEAETTLNDVQWEHEDQGEDLSMLMGWTYGQLHYRASFGMRFGDFTISSRAGDAFLSIAGYALDGSDKDFSDWDISVPDSINQSLLHSETCP